MGSRNALCQLKSVRNILFGKASNRRKILIVSQGHQNCRYSIIQYYQIARSLVAGDRCHAAAMPLVEHCDQRPQSSQRPHDGGVRGKTRNGGCLRGELTDGPLPHSSLSAVAGTSHHAAGLQDITGTTSRVQMTACDLKKFFIFEKRVEITSHVRFPIPCLTL